MIARGNTTESKCQVDLVDDKSAASGLAKLLREELREARFSAARLEHGDAELTSSGAMTTTLEPRTIEEFDAVGLRALHDAGVWKRDLFRSEIQVETLSSDPASAVRRTTFECLLDDLGVLSDGHIAHALGSLLPGFTHSRVQFDSPEETIGVAKTADLWRYVLVDACLGTPRRTASKVIRWARGGHVVFETRVLLGRLRAADSFVLANGIAVERLPHRSEELGDWLPLGAGIAPSNYLGRTMLRIPCTIAPGLSQPTKITGEQDGTPTVSWKTSADVQSAWRLPAGGVHQLVRALSLECDVAVETPVIWTDYGYHARFGQRHGWSNSGTGELPPRHTSGSPLTAKHLRAAIRLQPDLRNPPADVETAIRYWLKSKACGLDVADALVYLRTALESLFLDKGNQAELSFRLATHGAWYTGRNRQERQARYDALKKVYSAAFGAVHAGHVKNDGAKFLKDGQQICRLAILKRLRSKQKPVWDDIVFGS